MGIPNTEFAPMKVLAWQMLALSSVAGVGTELNCDQLVTDPPQKWQHEQCFSQAKICTVLSEDHSPANTDIAIAHISLCHLAVFSS